MSKGFDVRLTKNVRKRTANVHAGVIWLILFVSTKVATWDQYIAKLDKDDNHRLNRNLVFGQVTLIMLLTAAAPVIARATEARNIEWTAFISLADSGFKYNDNAPANPAANPINWVYEPKDSIKQLRIFCWFTSVNTFASTYCAENDQRTINCLYFFKAN